MNQTIYALIMLFFCTMSHAQQATKSFCFQVQTSWIDSVPASAPASHGGDYWRVNGMVPPVGAQVTVSTASSASRHNLDESGCVSISVPESSYSVKIRSSGTVKGIGIESYTDWAWGSSGVNPISTGDHRIASKTWSFQPNTFALKKLTLFSSDEIDSIAWHAFSLIAFAMNRDTYNLGHHGNSGNCGLPGVPCCGHEEWEGAGSTTVRSFTSRPGTGYSSFWSSANRTENDKPKVIRWFGYGDMFPNDISIPAVGSGVLSKWQMAHELGHVIVQLRMGKRTETNYDAELYGCMGQYNKGTLKKKSDNGDPNRKAPLTREFSSGASREGWASFFSAQLFNDVSESDCWYQSDAYMDGDMDRDIDNDYPGDTYKDGVFSCEGAILEPLLGEPDIGDPLSTWLHSRDWLQEVWDNSPICGSSESTSGVTGRSSQYDWMRYFWDMATDENIPVARLTDIYVDMCPTNWVAAPSGTVSNGNWPEQRLERSVNFHGFSNQHDRQKNNGVAHF